MNILDFISANIVGIVQIFVMILMFVYGYNKGFFKMAMSFVSLILTIIITKILMPYAISYAENSEWVNKFIRGRVINIMDSANPVTGVAVNKNIDVFYGLLGIDRLTGYMAEKISSIIIAILTFIILCILVNIILRLVFHIMDMISRFPVLNIINRIIGGVLGLIEALFYTWIFIMIIGILPENPLFQYIGAAYNDPDSFLYIIKESNIIVRILKNIVFKMI